jgi:carboxyl-terminal processing protease
MLLEGTIGYVPLGLFSESSTAEVRAAADSLRTAGATSLILDLRGNPGGILDQGVGITDLFLPSGAAVVETRGREGVSNGMLQASSGDRYEGMPLVVLVDRGSASASEIVAGALQDHDRALILGGSTFGKGSVQSLFSLSNGYVLKLTTARWYTPRGRSIERTAPGIPFGSTDIGGPDPDDSPTRDPPPVGEAAQHLPITVTGAYVLPADTAGRPTVTSNGGRTLYGGGGIVPDVLGPQDTLSSGEREATLALSREWGEFTLGIFNFTVKYLNERGTANRDFEVTEDDLIRLYEELRSERGIELDRETFLRAGRVVRFELESEIAAQGWGALEAFRHTLPYDAPLQSALELLRAADSPDDLFTSATRAGIGTFGLSGGTGL